jgi:hypothetical protein
VHCFRCLDLERCEGGRRDRGRFVWFSACSVRLSGCGALRTVLASLPVVQQPSAVSQYAGVSTRGLPTTGSSMRLLQRRDREWGCSHGACIAPSRVAAVRSEPVRRGIDERTPIRARSIVAPPEAARQGVRLFAWRSCCSQSCSGRPGRRPGCGETGIASRILESTVEAAASEDAACASVRGEAGSGAARTAFASLPVVQQPSRGGTGIASTRLESTVEAAASEDAA